MTASVAADDPRAWLAARNARDACAVRRVPFAELRGWGFAPGTGDLVHDSGRFFAVRGLRVSAPHGPVASWSQPIIDQPETGILGILVRRSGGLTHCLMQAKAEPGNVGGVQLSPTVQATHSNYTRVHRGARTRYLDYFTHGAHAARGRVLVDVLQSEQASWFLHKRNRNMIVEVPQDADVPLADGYRWIPLTELRALLRVDNVVNMDARSVLSSLSFPTGRGRAAPPVAETRDALDWLARIRAGRRLRARTVPLAQANGWRREADEIVHREGRFFRVIGVEVTAESREVGRWCQPLLAPCARGIVAFLVTRSTGPMRVLACARTQQGLREAAEIGPTVQVSEDLPPGPRPPYLDDVLGAPPTRVRRDVLLSEEGGRFHHAVNRYLVVEAPEERVAESPPEGFRWISAPCLAALSRGGHVNVEARTLLACLPDLGEPDDPGDAE
ncbi:NDP-hexose 2,3-dehydratase family protein [Streptomyces sp. PT12]|uniref:NDP-hexose 2,3-dehydratase family protein n=1 Tax=Streptomyces sp. PT12 TaxID=1510197 RepID=UPI000DE2B7CC|nr:NDP-hexose 2,3-dehydratase family protein [Streptomyces sp. PT12]RBM12325.1 NDP-hexose 2,3-dehydratase [Streptomyces sp. PT12]